RPAREDVAVAVDQERVFHGFSFLGVLPCRRTTLPVTDIVRLAPLRSSSRQTNGMEATVTALTPPRRPTWNPTWTLVAASLALMMAFLDALVVTTALPTLRHSLHSSLGNLEWTVNAYNLALACTLLTGAALGDRFGRRRMFVIGV